MNEYSILRFEAPMMSFGGPIVSDEGVIQPFPPLSMITGLLANALGYDQSEHQKHQDLQDSISYAVREDKIAEKIEDFQVANLGSSHMRAYKNTVKIKNSVAWTTWNKLDQRGSSLDGKTIRNREYWTNAVYKVSLQTDDNPPEEIREAFNFPERPLFIGRKNCIPATRIFEQTVQAPSLLESLLLDETVEEDSNPSRIWFESHDGMPVTDQRDWKNQIHQGTRYIQVTSYNKEK